MENLERYAAQFDAEYPDYADARYSQISEMMARYDSEAVEALISSGAFKEFVALILPVIAIKNYKTQVPFPEDVLAVVEAVVLARKAAIDAVDRFKELETSFNKLVAIQGFQLPTISAVFHFSHPESFPIVDRNVQAACEILIDRNSELSGYECPMIPAPGTSAANKLKKYRYFIQVIDGIRAAHPESAVKNSYRNMDKALMVLGSPELRKKVEAVSVAR